MTRYTVAWTDVAAQDLERQAAYLIDEASPARAERIIDRIIARADSLETSPTRGRIPRELRSIGDRTWREIQVSPWRILYRITTTRVEIHGVLDGRRSLDDLLLERLLHL